MWQSLGTSLYCQMLGWSLIQEGQQNIWHDLHSNTASGEMPDTECGHLHNLCRPYQRIWHSLSWKFIAMVREFYDCILSSVQNDCACFYAFPVTMVYLLSIALMVSFLTLKGCKLQSRCRQRCLMWSSLLMTWQRVFQQEGRYGSNMWSIW